MSPATVLLTFEFESLPKAVTVGFEYCKVQKYVPEPTRCYKCQRFGHVHSRYKHAEVCAICGEEEHLSSKESPCTEEA